jgi:hypothetical protein
LFWLSRRVLHAFEFFRTPGNYKQRALHPDRDADAASMLQFSSPWRHALRIHLRTSPNPGLFIVRTARRK